MNAVGKTVPVAVLVLNYNGRDVLEACLRSWTQSKPAPARLVVVDNQSSDGSLEQARKAFPQAEYVVNAENLGFAAGNNAGLDYLAAQGDKVEGVLLCNNDTTVEPDMLGLLWQAMDRHPRWAVAGPRILFADSGKVWFEGGRLDPVFGKPSHLRWGDQPGAAGEARTLPKGQFVTGCAMLMRTLAIRELGGLDAAWWAYAEDSDWCLRAQDAGWECGIVPAAQMHHKVSATFSAVSKRTTYLVTRNSLGLIRRHRLGLFWPLTVFLFAVVVGGWRAIGFVLRGRFQALAGLMAGTRDFFLNRWGAMR